MKKLIVRWVRDEDGQDLIEYALLAGFISLVVIAAVTLLGTNLNAVWEALAGLVGGIPIG
jgi:pilus assembly protein Flp/PilA